MLTFNHVHRVKLPATFLAVNLSDRTTEEKQKAKERENLKESMPEKSNDVPRDLNWGIPQSEEGTNSEETAEKPAGEEP
jgi:hypothetical protein